MANTSKEPLNKSILFKSLLKGDEIRYTDIIKSFLKDYDCNLFDESIPPLSRLCEKEKSEKIKIYREKHNTDIWIAKEARKKSGKKGKYEIPCILIEVKFKSLPDENQLTNYSKIFLEKYLESYKTFLKDSNRDFKSDKPLADDNIDYFKNDCNQKLQFYLITPFEEDMVKVCNKIKIDTIDDCKNNADEKVKETIIMNMSCKWQHVSFKTLGERIIKSIKSNKKEFKDDRVEFKNYRSYFFQDFALTLIDIYNLLTSIEGLNQIKIRPILEVFKNEAFEKLELENLYSKIRASQCALLLEESFIKNEKYIGQKPIEELINKSDGSIVINNAYSNNGGGIFEIARKVNNEITLIMQYQNKEIRKGIIIKKGTSASPYDGWFKDKWELTAEKNLEFKTKKIKEGEENLEDIKKYNYYSIKKNDTIMYYSTFRLNKKKKEETFKDKLSVEEVLLIMKNIVINDNPEIRSNYCDHKIQPLYF